MKILPQVSLHRNRRAELSRSRTFARAPTTAAGLDYLSMAFEEKTLLFPWLGTLARVSDVGILIIDSAHELEYASAKAREILWCDAEEDIQRFWRRVRGDLVGAWKDYDARRTSRHRGAMGRHRPRDQAITGSSKQFR